MLQKMRITVNSEKYFEEFSEKHFVYYAKYALVAFNALRRPLFQKFFNWILTREAIQKDKIKDVQIRMFPFLTENGNGLVGKCNSKGEIFLYPKRLKVFRKKMQEIGKENINVYIKSRARAALIHESLHLKYESNEAKVRSLTEKYFRIFLEHNQKRRLNSTKIVETLFNAS